MPRRSVRWLLAVVALAGATARDATPGALDAALATPALAGAEIAALVVDAQTGDVRFAHDPDRALVPASNQKVLTALAALATLGPTHRFVTSVLASGPVDAVGHVDTLYVRGGGDPALHAEDWWRLAADLRRGGLASARRLVVDDSVFDAQWWHPSWGAPSARPYFAPIAALQAEGGVYAVEVRPGAEAGDPVRVSVEPPADYLVLVSRAVTTAAGTPPSVTLDRGIGDGYESVVVSGRIAVGDAPTVIRRSVADPTAYAGSVLAFALRAQGIAVAERQVAGTVPADATVLLAFEGRPLADSVRLMLKYSSNPIAETLTKDLALAAGAGRADWTSGVAASRDALTQLGVDVAGLRMVDGSGLSYENRVTPRTLVSALRIARTSFAFGPELFSALPIAGLDGTLRSRASAVRGELRAKTGLLNHVAALSGEALTHGGRVVVFSVLVNGYRCGDDEAMRAIDGFAAAMIESDTGGRDAGATP